MEELSSESTSKRATNEDKPKKIVKASPIQKMNSTGKPSSSLTEENLLKAKFIKSYSKTEIVKKSILFSLRNWKFNVYNQVNTLINQFFSIYLPIYHAKIIDSITKQKDYNILYDSFKTYLFFLLIKLITSEGMQLFAYFFIRESAFS